jgi:hypothetical protein
VAAACETVNVRPPTPIVPLLAPPAFGATVNATAPPPDPLAPDVMVIQSALELADQAQPAPAVTLKLPDPPTASNEAVEDEIV